MGQVIALNVRSAFPPDLPADVKLPSHPCDGLLVPKKKNKIRGNIDQAKIETDGEASLKEEFEEIKEIDYCTILNRVLPEDIRVLCWTEVDPGFSSRFSAAGRSYRYFFVRKTLNIEAMRRGLQYLIGEHDFRNLCKLDVSNVSNFRREIFFAKIVPFRDCDGINASSSGSGSDDTAYDSIWMLEITGIAFLWHMIRCIMAILFLIGEGKEQPEIIPWLLNTAECPAKPFYTMAEDLPLVLNSCQFDNLQMKMQPRVLWSLTDHFATIWERHMLAAARAENALQFLRSREVRKEDWTEFRSSLLSKYIDSSTLKAADHNSSKRHIQDTASNDIDRINSDKSQVEPDFKRPKADSQSPDSAGDSAAVVSALVAPGRNSGDVVLWKAALEEMMQTYQIHPQSGATKYLPLRQVRSCA